MKLAALEAKSLFLQSLEEGNWADVTADPVEDSKLQGNLQAIVTEWYT